MSETNVNISHRLVKVGRAIINLNAITHAEEIGGNVHISFIGGSSDLILRDEDAQAFLDYYKPIAVKLPEVSGDLKDNDE